MTTIESSKKIAAMSSDPVMSKAAEIAFGRCGNCLKRVKCAQRLVDIPRAITLISMGSVKPKKPHKYTLEVAKLFKQKCAVCDQLGICILMWSSISKVPSYAPAATTAIRELGKKDEVFIAEYFEGLLHQLKLTPLRLMLKVGRMWWKCDKDKSYLTLVMHNGN